MGPVAEPYVIPYLNDPDGGLETEACQILNIIGTSKSLPLLKALRDIDNSNLGDLADKAIQSITARAATTKPVSLNSETRPNK